MRYQRERLRTLAALGLSVAWPALAWQAARPAVPRWTADPLNLLFVTEDGGRWLSLFGGERMESIHRFASPLPLEGKPKFTPDGRFAFFHTQGGWVVKYDLWQLVVAAQVRAGLEVRDLAVSADGRWVLVGNAKPETVLLLDAQLDLVRSYPAATLDGSATSPVTAVHDAAPRRSFVVSFEAMAELWEISYDPGAEPIFDGLVHDFRLGEAIAKPGFLGIRRTPLDRPLDIVLFDQPHRHVLATARRPGNEPSSTTQLEVVNLDVRRRIAQLALGTQGACHAAAVFTGQGRQLLAIAGRDDGMVRMPGRLPLHMAFTGDGAHAIVSLRDDMGALVAYDTRTLVEVKRLPAAPPAAAYPVMDRPAAGP